MFPILVSVLLAAFALGPASAASPPALAAGAVEIRAEQDRPQVCIALNEPLERDARLHFETFVHVEPHADFTVSVEERRICVDNLTHGHVYRVTLKRGLPSRAGGKLGADKSVDAWIPDRQQRIGFQPGGYVLPANGPRQLVLRTVNIREVQVKILRVPTAGLSAEFRKRWAQSSLVKDDVEQLAAGGAEDVYRGILTVPEGPNRTIETGLPLDEALANAPPGLYVAIAGRRGERQEFRPFSAQWFVLSDLGLVTYSGKDGLTASVHALSSGAAVSGVDLNLIARDNRELGRAITGPDGTARFDAAALSGAGGNAPSLLVAGNGDADVNFLDLETAPYDFADRGVEGRAGGTAAAFIALPRTLYRPGARIDAVALFRDSAAKASEGVNAILRLIRPDGIESATRAVKDEGRGAVRTAFTVPLGAPSGRWRIEAQADQRTLGTIEFTVADPVPAKLDVDIAGPESALPDRDVSIAIRADFFSGGPAAGSALRGHVKVFTAERPPLAPPAYHFGAAASLVQPQYAADLAPGALDAKGRGQLIWHAPDLRDHGRPLIATIEAEVFDPAGRIVRRSIAVPLIVSSFHVGVRPDFADGRVAEQSSASFDVIGVDGFGHQIAANGLRYEVVGEEPDYIWRQGPGGWSYSRVLRDRPLGGGIFAVRPGEPTRIATPILGHGRYRIDITDPLSGALTAYRFAAGYWSDVDAQAAPDTIQIGIEPGAHKAGEALKIFLRPPYDAQILLATADDRIRDVKSFTIPVGGATVEMPMPGDVAGGLHVLATAFGDPSKLKGALAARAYGAQWVSADDGTRQLHPHLSLPKDVRPGGTLPIPVSIDGLGETESADVVLAAVDETGASAWSPSDFFLGPKRLGLQIRDLFGRLIDARGVPRGELRAGGDLPRRTAATAQAVLIEDALSPQAPPPQAETPLAAAGHDFAVMAGPVRITNAGATIPIDLPPGPRALKLIALAWSEDKIGAAEQRLDLHDAVDTGFDPPARLHLGDRVKLDLKPAGPFKVSLAAEPGLAIDGGAVTAAAPGRHRLTIEARGADGALVLERHAAIDVAMPWPLVSRRQTAVIEAGRSPSLQSALHDLSTGLVPDSVRADLGLSLSPMIDAAGLLRSLTAEDARDPEGLIDRLVVGLAPGEITDALALPRDAAARAEIEMLARDAVGSMDQDGEIKSWTGDKAASDWLTAYAVDLLWRLREKSYSVPQTAIDRGIARLQMMTAAVDEPPSSALAYALFVLARAHAAEVADLRQFDDRAGPALPQLARAQLAAGLMILGDKERARWRLQNPASGPAPRGDFGTALRDLAGAAALGAEFKILRNEELTPLADRLAEEIARTPRLSAQEQAWCLMAVYQMPRRPGNLALTVEGKPETERNFLPYRALKPGDGPLTIENRARQVAFRLLSVSGAPREAPAQTADGITIRRALWTQDGKPADPKAIARGARLVVTLDIARNVPGPLDLRITDALPAGLEVEGTDLNAMSLRLTAPPVRPDWIDTDATAYRAALHLDPARKEARLAFLVRATRAGQFAWPGTIAADAIRAQIRAQLPPTHVAIGG